MIFPPTARSRHTAAIRSSTGRSATKTGFHTVLPFLSGMRPALAAAARRHGESHGMWRSFGWGHVFFGGLMMVLVPGAVIGLIGPGKR